MPATPEQKVKKRVTAILDELGVYHFFPATHGYGRSGVPDIVGCIPGGLFIAIECKATSKNKPTALQVHEIEAIRKRNGCAVVVHADNVDMLRGFLKRLIKETKHERDDHPL